jgi:drug/metabolite transporter (DMT)-like permease
MGPAIAAFLLYTGGVFALIFYRIFLKIRINTLNWIAFLIAVLGVAIILKPWEFLGDLNYNILISLLSGVLLGMNITIRKKIYLKMEIINDSFKRSADFYIAMVLFPTSMLAILFLPFSFNDILNFTSLEWLFAILLGLIPTSLAFTLYNIGLQGDTNGDVIILSYIEPIIASIINAILISALEITVLVGGSIILIANIIILFNKKA